VGVRRIFVRISPTGPKCICAPVAHGFSPTKNMQTCLWRDHQNRSYCFFLATLFKVNVGRHFRPDSRFCPGFAEISLILPKFRQVNQNSWGRTFHPASYTTGFHNQVPQRVIFLCLKYLTRPICKRRHVRCATDLIKPSLHYKSNRKLKKLCLWANSDGSDMDTKTQSAVALLHTCLPVALDGRTWCNRSTGKR